MVAVEMVSRELGNNSPNPGMKSSNYSSVSEVQGKGADVPRRKSYMENTSVRLNEYNRRKGYMTNTPVKLNEYNQINNDYVLRSNLFTNSVFTKYYATNLSALPNFGCKSNVNTSGADKGVKVSRSSRKLYKRKLLPFKPTELSTIFENLAY